LSHRVLFANPPLGYCLLRTYFTCPGDRASTPQRAILIVDLESLDASVEISPWGGWQLALSAPIFFWAALGSFRGNAAKLD
jgi:hypothetical protein